MFSLNFIAGIGIIFIVISLGVLFLMPGGKKPKKRRKKDPTENQQQKDWKQAAVRLEKHTYSLRGKLASFEKKEKAWEKQLMVEKARNEKLQEKLSRERGWHEKEQRTLDKRGEEFQELKTELLKVQENFGKEHALNLRLQRELESLKRENDSGNDQRRALESENAQCKAKMQNYRMEIAHLKKENAELTKKKEDTSWVAKSDYAKLEKLLQEKEKELERIKRELEPPQET